MEKPLQQKIIGQFYFRPVDHWLDKFQVFSSLFSVITINFISIKEIVWSLQQTSYTIVTKNISFVWVSRLGHRQLIHSLLFDLGISETIDKFDCLLWQVQSPSKSNYGFHTSEWKGKLTQT